MLQVNRPCVCSKGHKLSYVTVSETEARHCNSASVTLFSIKLNDIIRLVYRNCRMLSDAVTHDAHIVMMMMMNIKHLSYFLKQL